ncbi:MAG TPA: dihydrodipicolinate reductase C-terminal domain-containing protein [Terriglobales bacterium]|jgi:4-hydroxy-tetrahydrodipicolinate reductase|nr:dihydrodipicolinate reductase C-terminal domain-containing protein [Terriglobales bacterium]
MKLLILGRGKTGALVADIAHERKHEIKVLSGADNSNASALTKEKLQEFDAVIDFTRPDAVMKNIQACIDAGTNMVVGTTGWYEKIPEVRRQVESANTALLFGANFSIGVNLFYEIARAGAVALKHEYQGHIFERHHTHKKDAPSGTAAMLQKIIQEASRTDLEITSFREGDVVGMHEVILDSPADTIYLCHDAKSRVGFAEGAVKAAEWLKGKKGFYDFREVWREL